MARAADANRNARSGDLSKTASPSNRITASWTTAVGGRVWSVPLPAHQAGGDLAQLVIDQRDELTPGPLVAGPGPSQDQSQIAPRLGPHHPSIEKNAEGFHRILRGTYWGGKERRPG